MPVLSQLIEADIPSPKLEARMIAEYAAKHHLSDEQIKEIVGERLKHKPLDKILGEREFYKYEFAVSEAVLTPRPDTEILVEEAIRILRNKDKASVLDLGVGSGCILLSILKDCAQVVGVGVDLSDKALQVAGQNADKLGLIGRVELIKADWFENESIPPLKFNLIVSNPPYIPTGDIAMLEPEVKDYDPRLALDGGKDGLDSYRSIAEITPGLLEVGGYLLLEIGISQAEAVKRLFEKQGFKCLRIVPDLAGIPRCVVLQK